MPNAAGFYSVQELVWPVTYIWHMSVPWGRATLKLTVDYPDAVDSPERTAGSVIPLWRAAVAPATSFLTGYLTGAAYIWKYGFSAGDTGEFPVGENGIHPLGKDHGVTLVMQTGYTDRQGMRRLIMPACPSSWVDGSGQMTEDGAGKALTWARGLLGGLNGSLENAPFRWMLPFPDVIADPLTGFTRPGFRDVVSVRLCSYTVPVPVSSFAD